MSSKEKITLAIDSSGSYCGKCDYLISWNHGISMGCRIFSKNIGSKRHRGLYVDIEQRVVRHPDCLLAARAISKEKDNSHD